MSTISDMVMASEEADDGMEQWEPEPSEGGYEVVRIYPYGDGAEEFVEDITSMARHDPDLAGISASGVGFPLDEAEVTSVRLGGLAHDGHGNLILQKRERRKEVLEAERKGRAAVLQGKLDELIADLEAEAKDNDDQGNNAINDNKEEK
jgi:hypothetical protein